MIDWSSVKLYWFTKPTHIEDCDLLVIQDCEESLWGLDRISDLTFHTICLSDSLEHDIVTVWGEDDDDILYCDYDQKPKWVTLKEMQKNREV